MGSQNDKKENLAVIQKDLDIKALGGGKVFSLFLKDQCLHAINDRSLFRWGTDLNLELKLVFQNSFNCSVVVSDELIAIGNMEGRITLINPNNPQKPSVSTATEHKSWVSSLIVCKENIISSSFDDVIHVWKIDDKSQLECISTWTLPTNKKRGIYCMVEWNDYIAVGTNSREILLLNQQGQTVATLQGHSLYVLCLTVWEGKLVSGSGDNTIRLWNINTINHQIQHNLSSSTGIITINSCDRILRGHKGTVRTLLVWHSKLFSASSDGTVRLWNMAGQDIRVLKPRNNTSTKLEIRRMIIWQHQCWCAVSNDSIMVFQGENDLYTFNIAR